MLCIFEWKSVAHLIFSKPNKINLNTIHNMGTLTEWFEMLPLYTVKE